MEAAEILNKWSLKEPSKVLNSIVSRWKQGKAHGIDAFW